MMYLRDLNEKEIDIFLWILEQYLKVIGIMVDAHKINHVYL